MRIAIFSTCPGGVYSGGRYHALIAGYCLARRGHEVYFVTDNEPVFDADLRMISPDNPVTIVETKDFEVVSDLRFDHVIIAPQMTKYRRLYMNAIRLAEHSQAALSFFCFEAANWFNAVSPVKRPLAGWSEWHLPVARGALILCSAEESRLHAQTYFTERHPDSAFGVWQPAINQIALEAAPDSAARGDILIFARPLDAHKGSDVVEQLLVPELKDNRIVVVIGNPRGAEAYQARLESLARQSGNQISFRFGLSDIEKFAALKQASALVFPSFFEGYGYPPIEALATNTHCIAYDLPVIRENCGDELVRYVPPGDVAALRAELITALQEPQPQSAQHPAVVWRTDIDVRAQALEEVLETYRAQRHARQLLSSQGLAKLNCLHSPPEQIRLGDRVLYHFMLSAPQRISAASFLGNAPASCQVIPTIAVQGAILHHVVIDMALQDGEPPVWEGGKLLLTFHGQAGGAVILSPKVRDLGAAKAFAPAFAGLTQIFEGAGGVNLFAWALPEQDYDAALWVSTTANGTRCVAGDIGLVTAGHRAKSGINQQASCGIGFYLPAARDLGLINHLLLLRNGAIVFSSAIPAQEIDKAGRKTATEIGRPIVSATPAKPRGLYRSRSYRSEGRVQLGGWTDAAEQVVELEIRSRLAGGARGPVLTRLAPNATRPDIVARHGLSRDDIGFCCMLPPQGEYAAVLMAQGREVGQISPVKTDADEGTLPELKSGRLALALQPEMQGGSLAVVRRPPKQAISQFNYDAQSRKLSLQGWVLATGAVMVSLLRADTFEVVGQTDVLKERQDVAQKFGSKFLQSGIDLLLEVETLCPAGYLLQITLDGKSYEPERMAPVHLANVKEFRVADCRYDPRWPSLWVRGSFVCPGTRLAAIEIRQGGRVLCTGAVNVKQARHGDPLAGWRVESVLDHPIDPGQPLEVRGLTADKAQATTRFVPAEIVAPPAAAPLDQAVARLGLDAAFRAQVVPAGLDPERTVLLVVHNLDAVDRPEKRMALVSLRAALAAQGLQLVIFHHCRNRMPGDLPEINFFDPVFDLVRQIEGSALSAEVRAVLGQQRLNRTVGALHGFLSSLNLSPPAWKDCIAQIEDEALRLFYVLRLLNPRHVLLWHQWNSLMEIGRGLCQSMGLSSAYLHEGMLPKTMTYDPSGMMAEAQSVGARLSLPGAELDPQEALWLERAENVITTIRDEGLDRKPLSGLRIGSDLRRIAEAMGAKVVFYAGINDWHSGNLPEDGGAIHSPFFRDTGDGLEALLEIAEENNWLVLFKPHPNLYPRHIEAHPRLFVVRESNTLDCVDAADVVVTILSSICYISLARGKATVLLGRNTLSGTGAAHELTARGDLAAVVGQALDQTGLSGRLAAFRDHVAALLRDHLYCYDPADTLALQSHDVLVQRMLGDLRPGAEIRLPEPEPEPVPEALAAPEAGRGGGVPPARPVPKATRLHKTSAPRLRSKPAS